MTITEFLTARLDEDEGWAANIIAATGPPNPGIGEHGRWNAYLEGGDDGYAIEDDCGCDGGFIVGQRVHAEHIARHDPVRVLREVAAKRKILARCEFASNQVAVGEVNEAAGYGRPDPGWPLRADSHDLDVRALAAVYSDHPDYDQSWA